MKKIKLDTAKLQLKKERITELTSKQSEHIMGGATPTNGCQTALCTATCKQSECIQCCDNLTFPPPTTARC